MTALTTLAAPPVRTRTPSLRPVPWRRMAWVTWRQHRTALIGVARVARRTGAVLLIVGLQLHHAYAVGDRLPSGELGSLRCRGRQLQSDRQLSVQMAFSYSSYRR